MKFYMSASIVFAVLFSACDNSDQAVPSNSDIIIVDSNAGFSMDELRIKNILVNGDILTAEVEYGGGCGSVEFNLLSYSGFMESNPVQSALTISFKDEDPCKALVTRIVRFNLRPLAETYKAAYQTSSGTILLRIENYEPLIPYSF